MKNLYIVAILGGGACAWYMWHRQPIKESMATMSDERGCVWDSALGNFRCLK